jgi:hypothetical protein
MSYLAVNLHSAEDFCHLTLLSCDYEIGVSIWPVSFRYPLHQTFAVPFHRKSFIPILLLSMIHTPLRPISIEINHLQINPSDTDPPVQRTTTKGKHVTFEASGYFVHLF